MEDQIIMGIDAIQSLKSNLADLTYILFVFGKELELIIENSEDKKVYENLRQTISTLQDSNNEVIKLYHKISTHEVEIQNEWYDDETKIKSLQQKVDSLKESISVLLEGNKNFLSING